MIFEMDPEESPIKLGCTMQGKKHLDTAVCVLCTEGE